MEITNIGWEEYVVFVGVLILSMGIGIYFGYFGNKQKTTENAFLPANNRQMSSIPVALSLICSAVSAVTILSNPVEIYMYGTQYILFILSLIPFTISLAYLYVPVYFNLNINSAYEFIEIRFNSTVRLFVSVLGVFYLTIVMAMAVHAASLGIGQVIGLDTKIPTIIIYLVCMFYSGLVRTGCSKGSLKAVLWVDVLQAGIMLTSLLAIAIKGISDVGGLSIIWERVNFTGRIKILNFDLDTRTRHTIWTSVVGGYFYWLSFYATSQLQVQRFLSLPTLARARRAIFINFFGLVIIIGLCFIIGLVIIAKFYDCDPITTKQISRSDQLVPYFVESSTEGVPGLLGLFIAGITSASMSSLSSGLFTLASITTYDYLNKLFPELTGEKLLRISLISTFVIGMVSFGFVFVVGSMESILLAMSSVVGAMAAPVLGLFSLGMFFPWANSKGSVFGLILAFGIMITFVIGSNIVSSDLPDQKLPLSQHCCININGTTMTSSPMDLFLKSNLDLTDHWKEKEYTTLVQILSMSYTWNSALGCCLSVFLGLICSLIINLFSDEKERKLINPKCISPPVLVFWRKFFPSRIDGWVAQDI